MADWKGAVARVWAGKPTQGGVYKGTAFLVADRKLVTARHVIDHIEPEDIVLQGATSWRNGTRRVDSIDQSLASKDVVVLTLSEPGEAGDLVPIEYSENQPSIQGREVTIGGYTTDTGSLETPDLKVSMFFDDFGLYGLHTPIGKGMSGGPVILRNRLVGMSRATDDNKAWVLPIRAFLPLLQNHGLLHERTSSGGTLLANLEDDHAIHSMRIAVRVEDAIAGVLSRHGVQVLKERLSASINAHPAWPGQPTDQPEKALILGIDLEWAVDRLRDATREALERLAALSDEYSACWRAGKDILGWLCLLAVDESWLERRGLLDDDGQGFNLRLAHRKDSCVEIILSRIQTGCPGWRRETGKPTIFGSRELAIQHLPETGYGKNPQVIQLKRLIYMVVNSCGADDAPEEFDEFDDEDLNENLIVQARDKRDCYLSIPGGADRNPVHGEVYETLRKDLPNLRMIFIGVRDGDSALLLRESRIDALIRAFLDVERQLHTDGE